MPFATRWRDPFAAEQNRIFGCFPTTSVNNR